MAFQQGDRVGDYEILGTLGKGGMGQVYKVRNVISDRVEAMKVLLPGLEGSSDLADRFLREIKVQARLQHPNIAGLHSAQRSGDQVLMFMELVEGRTVEQELREGGIPVARGVDYVRQVLGALAYAHSQGVVHRDIKPANMMVTPQGVVKLMDFGIAKVAADSKLTQTGHTLGSYYYMSPEQINGGPLDERADLYSLGISLYEIVTGKLPFAGDSAFSVMAAHLHTAPKPPIELDPKLPDLLNEVIMMSIAKETERRFQTAQAFGNALSSAADLLGPVPALDPAIARTPAPVDFDGPTRILNVHSVASTRTLGSIPPPTAPMAVPVPPAAMAAPPPQPPPPMVQSAGTRTSNLGLFVAIGLIVVVSAAGVAAWKGKALFPSSAPPAGASEAQQAIPTPAPAVSATPAQAPVAAPVSPAEQAAPPPQPTATPAQAVPDGRHSPMPAASSAPAAAQNSRPQIIQRPMPAPLPPSQPSSSPAAAPVQQQAPVQVQAQAPPQQPVENPMEELRDSYNKLVVRAATVQEGVGRLEAQQRASGFGLRGDMLAAKIRMGVNLKLAEGALNGRDPNRLKVHLKAAEADVDKLESFLGH